MPSTWKPEMLDRFGIQSLAIKYKNLTSLPQYPHKHIFWKISEINYLLLLNRKIRTKMKSHSNGVIFHLYQFCYINSSPIAMNMLQGTAKQAMNNTYHIQQLNS